MAKIAHVGGVPLGDVSPECAALEHIRYALHARCIPLGDVAVELGVLEHPVHLFHVGNVPARNIPIECTATEHVRHVRNVRDIPLGNIAVEWAVCEQPVHVLNARNIDVVEAALGAVLLHVEFDGIIQLRTCLGHGTHGLSPPKKEAAERKA